MHRRKVLFGTRCVSIQRVYYSLIVLRIARMRKNGHSLHTTMQKLSGLIDSHCHLDFEQFDDDREAVLRRANDCGVAEIIVPGVTAQGWQNLITLCQQHPGLYYALGLHPVFLDRHQPGDIAELAKQLPLSSAIAVGEIGLDFYLPELNREQQKSLFTAQLELAQEFDLPVILHVRKAHDATLSLLQQHPVKGGIVHAFNGSLQQAEKYQQIGFKLGFGGMLTYERSRKLRALASALPLSAIVLETDAPDMVVASHRGEPNSPVYLPEVVQAMASIRQESAQEIVDQTSANTRQVLQLDQPQ